MKKNNKGFMMAELIVVTSIVLLAVTTFYASYHKIYSTYQKRINYNDIKSLNRLVFFRDSLIEDCDSLDENCKINTLISNAKRNPSRYRLQNISNEINLIDVNNDVKNHVIVSETTFLYYNEKRPISSTIFNNVNVNPTYKDYIDYISDSIPYNKTNFIMLIERCYTEDKCKYAYLQIYD